MQRRSARLRQQPPKFREDRAEEVVQEELNADAAVEKPKPKKRKMDAEDTGGPTLPKKPRGMRGLLQKVLEIPLELLFEIFSRLQPADLLNLARTSKDLRALLMNRSSSSIWKAARDNVPRLPKRPKSLSEPRYADLMFGKSCHLCSRNVSNMYYCWASRIRACMKCIEGNGRFKKREDTQSRPHSGGGRLQPPTVTITKAGRRKQTIVYYDAKLDAIWAAKYRAAKNKTQWLADKLQERSIINKHARACAVWHQNLQASVIHNRKAAVLDYLKQLGWADELLKMDSSDHKVEDLDVVVKACKKNITKQVLADMKATLVEFMETHQKTRLEREHTALLDRRLRMLKKVLETYVSTLPVNALHPNAGELFRNPTIRNMIFDESSHESLDSVFTMLPDLTVQWQKDIQGQLLDMIKSARPDYAFNADTVFDLATTIFACPGCRKPFMRYPQVLMHSCAIRFGRGTNVFDKTSDQYFLTEIINETFWNGLRRIKYRKDSVKVMTEVLEIAGFDPTTTTAAEMDKADPILECITCNSESHGRLTMNWTQAAAHRLEAQCGKSMEMELLNEEEAAIVRARMVEDKEKARFHRLAFFVCFHCKKEACFQNLRKHVKNDHGKSPVTAEDIVPRIEDRDEMSLFRLWPAREE